MSRKVVDPSIHTPKSGAYNRRHLERIDRHESIQYVEGAEPDAEFLQAIDRLLISHEPNINTFLQLFRNIYGYYTMGKDAYWRKNNERIADPIPCSQDKFWEYQEIYEKWTHPDFRYHTNAPSNAEVDMKLMEGSRTPKVTYSPLDPHELYQRMKCPNEDAM